ncbi:siroheme synthase CysG [Pseudomonadota bacterium]
MDYLPIFFNIKNQHCLVVGGGSVALRKANLLVEAGAVVRIVAQQIKPELSAMVVGAGGQFHQRAYVSTDVQGVHLVVAATNDEKLNRQVSKDAQNQNTPVNVVDKPELCSFIFPAIVDRSPVVVAVSSGGRSPVLARLMRTRIESFIPMRFGELAVLAGKYRQQVQKKFKQINQRRSFWEKILSGPVAEKVLQGKQPQAEELLQQTLSTSDNSNPAFGEVYLVGAGPGDPDLLTFKALRLLQQADVVVYDRLVSKPILALSRRDADKIYVGKARANHSVDQLDINALLVKLALEGKRVCRLKGGDPFIFGRGGEEIESIVEKNIPFQVVPGITAASGCAAYAGIPLTHRDYSQSVRFITGHLRAGAPELNWHDLVQERQTIVFYMGLVGLENICENLVKHGMDPKMPVALVEQGTTENQRVVVGDLSDIADKVKKNKVRAPTITILGEVVRLHKKYQWFSTSID